MKRFAVLLLAAPLALAACGGSSKQVVAADPVAYVKQAATKTAALTSEHMVMKAQVTGTGTPVALQGTGDFANNPLKGSFAMTVSFQGKSETLNEVLDGSALYMEGIGLSQSKPWAKVDLAEVPAASHLSLLSQNPTDFLKQLASAGSVKSLGAETIDGVETTHYQVTGVDLSKFPLAAELESQAHVTFGPIDVWIRNSDGYVARESLSFSAKVNGKGASASLSADFSQFNEPVTVTVPPASETVDLANEFHGGTQTTFTTISSNLGR